MPFRLSLQLVQCTMQPYRLITDKQQDRSQPIQGRQPAAGGIRLLVVNKITGSRKGLFLKKSIYEALEKSFHLHVSTLLTYFGSHGANATFKDTDPETGAVKRLSILFKPAVQKDLSFLLKPATRKEWTIRFLSVTHDFSTSLTTGLIIGRNILTSKDLQQTHLWDMIQSSPRLWSHPTLLPTILLGDFEKSLRDKVKDSRGELVNLDRSVGVTQINPSEKSSLWQKWPESIDIKTLTVEIHSMAARLVLFTGRVRWLQRSIQVLLETEAELEKEHALKDKLRTPSQKVCETLKFMSAQAENSEQFLDRWQQRVQLQTNVVSPPTTPI